MIRIFPLAVAGFLCLSAAKAAQASGLSPSRGGGLARLVVGDWTPGAWDQILRSAIAPSSSKPSFNELNLAVLGRIDLSDRATRESLQPLIRQVWDVAEGLIPKWMPSDPAVLGRSSQRVRQLTAVNAALGEYLALNPGLQNRFETAVDSYRIKLSPQARKILEETAETLRSGLTRPIEADSPEEALDKLLGVSPQDRSLLRPAAVVPRFEGIFGDAGFAMIPKAEAIDVEGLRPSFDHLEIDPYIKGDFKFRLRRYSIGEISPEGFQWLPPEPLFQTLEVNRYAGGFARVLHELEDPTKKKLVGVVRYLYSLLPPGKYQFDVHQFRIVADSGHKGDPAPEGIHRDGVDYGALIVVDRRNVKGGVSVLWPAPMSGKRPIFKKILAPGETLFFDDARILHYASAISPEAPGDAHRDTVVILFKRLGPAPPAVH